MNSLQYTFEKQARLVFIEFLRRALFYGGPWANQNIELVEINEPDTSFVQEFFHEEPEQYPIVTVRSGNAQHVQTAFNDTTGDLYDLTVPLGERSLQLQAFSTNFPFTFQLPTDLSGNFGSIAMNLMWNKNFPIDDIQVKVFKNYFSQSPQLLSSGSIPAFDSLQLQQYVCSLFPQFTIPYESSTTVELTPLNNAQYVIALDPTASNYYTNVYYNGTTPVPFDPSLENFHLGTGTGSIAGTPVSFPSPLLLPYQIFFKPGVGITYINPQTNEDTRTPLGFTAFSAQDNIPFSYLAEENKITDLTAGSIYGGIRFYPVKRMAGAQEFTVTIRCSAKNSIEKAQNLSDLIEIYTKLAQYGSFNRTNTNPTKITLSQLVKNSVAFLGNQGIFIKNVSKSGIENRRRGDNDIIFTISVNIDVRTEWSADFDEQFIKAFEPTVTGEIPSPINQVPNISPAPINPALYRLNIGVATIIGTPIFFSNPPFSNYQLFFYPGLGITYINPNTGQDTRTPYGFTAFSSQDNVQFAYIAEINQ